MKDLSDVNHDAVFLYSLPGLDSITQEFFTQYECQNILVSPNDRMPSLKPQENRMCKFCGLGSSKTKFKSKPHIIPYFLGNKYGISDFECDRCNSLFAKYESHLAYYLGLNQTLSGSISRKGIPTLKSSKKDLEVRAMNIYGVDGIMIQKTSQESKAIEWSEDDIISITFSKGSYTPTSVYKILLKIALSSLTIDENTNYRTAFNFILQQNANLAGMATVGIFEFESNIVHQFPFGYLFKKRLETALVPTHQFALYFQNRIFTFCLPYNINDERIGLFNGQKREVLIAPPLTTIPVTGNIPFRYTTVDFSSNDLVKGEEQIMTFKLNSEQIKHGILIDQRTGERAMSTPQEKPGAKGIFLVPPNTVIPFNSFKQHPPPKMCYE